MTDTHRACITCRGETKPKVLDSIAGEDKELAVAVRALNVLECANGHRQFTRADSPLELLKHLVEEDEPELPAGEEKGLFFKHFHCNDCGKELLPKPDHRHTFSVEPGLPDQPGLKVDLTMAVYKCGGCGKEQLHSLKELCKLTPTALANAFRAAEIQSG
ncbi:MAG TPA: hypothetical protein VIT02_03230 [Burkholderiaceae bacterium]